MALIPHGKTVPVTIGVTADAAGSSNPYDRTFYPLALTVGLSEPNLYLNRLPDATIISTFDLESFVGQDIHIRDVSFDSVTGDGYVMFKHIADSAIRLMRIPDLRENSDFSGILTGTPIFDVSTAVTEHTNCLAVYNNVAYVLDGSVASGASGRYNFVARAYDLSANAATRNASKDISFQNNGGDAAPIGYFDIFAYNIMAWCEGLGTPTLQQVEEIGLGTPGAQRTRAGIPDDYPDLIHTELKQSNVYISKFAGSGRTGNVSTIRPASGIFARANSYFLAGARQIPYVGVGVDVQFTTNGNNLPNVVFCTVEDLDVQFDGVYEPLTFGYTTFNSKVKLQTAATVFSTADWQSSSSKYVYFPAIRSDDNNALFDRVALVTDPSPTVTGDEENIANNNPDTYVVRSALTIQSASSATDGDGNVITTVPRNRQVDMLTNYLPEFALTASGDIGFVFDGFRYTIESIRFEEFQEGPYYLISCTYVPVVN